MLQLASFLLLGHDDVSQKIVQDPLCLAPVLINKMVGREKKCFRQISNWDHRKTEECRTKPSEFCLPFFIGGPLHPCCRRKFSVPPYGCTVLQYCILLYYSTVLLLCHYYCCTVLCCTVLYCTVPYCTVLYCTVLYCAVLYRTFRYGTVRYCIVLYCTVLYSYVVLYWTVLIHCTVALSCTRF